MKNKPHVNIPQINNSKPLVKRILIEIIEDEKGESKTNFTSNNLSPFEILGLLDYFKNMHETTMFIENRKKADGEKLSQNVLGIAEGRDLKDENVTLAQMPNRSTNN